jgi:hypothetical protein
LKASSRGSGRQFLRTELYIGGIDCLGRCRNSVSKMLLRQWTLHGSKRLGRRCALVAIYRDFQKRESGQVFGTLYPCQPPGQEWQLGSPSV